MRILPQQARPAPLPPHPLPVIPEEETPQQPQDPLTPQQPDQAIQEQPLLPENETIPSQNPVEQAANTAPRPTPKPQVAQRTQSQFIEITMEDSRVNKFKSNAPLKERQAMQRAIDRVKQSNQQALRDIGAMFDGDTQAQAFAIVAKSEKILVRTANTSNNYQNYLNAQRKILQEQEAQLNQLMRQNAYKLRRIRS